MANGLFVAYKQESLGDAAGPGHGAVDWEADTIAAYLIDHATATPSTTTHADLADITGSWPGTGGFTNLASKTAVASGTTVTMDAANTTLASVVDATAHESVVVAKNTGVESTSLLIAYFDSFTSGMPVTPNGGDIVITWNASGIFAW